MAYQLDKRFCLVAVHGAENLGCVEANLVLDKFVDIVSNQGQVEDQCQPLTTDEHQKGDECLKCGLGDQKLSVSNSKSLDHAIQNLPCSPCYIDPRD